MSLRILMVEDDNSVAEMMGMFFKKEGWQQARRRLARRRYLCRKLRPQYCRTLKSILWNFLPPGPLFLCPLEKPTDCWTYPPSNP